MRYGSRIYRARSEVPKDGKEPGKDARWEELRAQGVPDYSSMAQALLSDSQAMGAIVQDFAQHMQAHLAGIQESYGIQLPPDFAARLNGAAAQCLQTVVGQFTA